MSGRKAIAVYESGCVRHPLVGHFIFLLLSLFLSTFQFKNQGPVLALPFVLLHTWLCCSSTFFTPSSGWCFSFRKQNSMKKSVRKSMKSAGKVKKEHEGNDAGERCATVLLGGSNLPRQARHSSFTCNCKSDLFFPSLSSIHLYSESSVAMLPNHLYDRLISVRKPGSL